MALPTKVIRVRSPYFVGESGEDLHSIYIEVRVWTGNLVTDRPTDLTYELYSTALYDPRVGLKAAQLDISDYARDFIDVTYQSNATKDDNSIWIEYSLYKADEGETEFTLVRTEQLTGILGYVYFEQGLNYDLSPNTLLNARTIWLPNEDESARIPVLQDRFLRAEFYDYYPNDFGPLPYHTHYPDPLSEDTEDVIRYVFTSFGGGTPKHIKLYYSDGSTDTRLIRYTPGGCANNPVKITFTNAYGANEDFFFSGANRSTLATESTDYKRHLLQYQYYDKTRAQTATLKKNSTLSLQLNSGWMYDDANSTLQELMNALTLWGEIPSELVSKDGDTNRSFTTLPLTVETKSLQFLTRATDKLVNYPMNFRAAAPRINDIK